MTIQTAPTARDGATSWLVAGTATAVLAVVLGVFGSIGVLVDPLAAGFDASRAQLVLLLPAALAVHSVVSPVAGRAVDRWGPRPLLGVAGAGMGLGLLAPATAPSVWVAVAGYGVGLGLASACAWGATTAVVCAAFDERRSAALGLLTAGPAAGGVVLAPAMTALTQAYGPRFTCATLAVLGVAACAVGAVQLGGRLRPAPVAAAGAVPQPGLRHFSTAALLMGLVVFLPLVFVAGHAVDLGLTPAQGATVLVVVSATSAAARVGAGRLARPGTLPVLYLAAHVLVAAAFVVWAFAGWAAALPTLLAGAVLFGAGYGAWLSLGPALLAATCDPLRLGRALGRLAAAVGVGGVVGPVLAAPLLAAAPGVLFGACAVIALGAAATGRWPGRPGRGCSCLPVPSARDRR